MQMSSDILFKVVFDSTLDWYCILLKESDLLPNAKTLFIGDFDECAIFKGKIQSTTSGSHKTDYSSLTGKSGDIMRIQPNIIY